MLFNVTSLNQHKAFPFVSSLALLETSVLEDFQRAMGTLLGSQPRVLVPQTSFLIVTVSFQDPSFHCPPLYICMSHDKRNPHFTTSRSHRAHCHAILSTYCTKLASMLLCDLYLFVSKDSHLLDKTPCNGKSCDIRWKMCLILFLSTCIPSTLLCLFLFGAF